MSLIKLSVEIHTLPNILRNISLHFVCSMKKRCMKAGIIPVKTRYLVFAKYFSKTKAVFS